MLNHLPQINLLIQHKGAPSPGGLCRQCSSPSVCSWRWGLHCKWPASGPLLSPVCDESQPPPVTLQGALRLCLLPRLLKGPQAVNTGGYLSGEAECVVNPRVMFKRAALLSSPWCLLHCLLHSAGMPASTCHCCLGPLLQDVETWKSHARNSLEAYGPWQWCFPFPYSL